jgi:HEAT repeat protein
MSTVPDGTPDRPEPPPRTTIFISALGGVAAFTVIILVLFRVLGGVNQAMNNAAEEQRQRDEQNRRQLDRLFGGKQPAAEPTRDRALEDVEHADAAIRHESVVVIARLYMTDPKTVPALVKRLTDDTDARVRLAALRALRTIDPRPPAVTEALQSATKDDDPRVRADAKAALVEGK